jgi:antitoxin Phd
MSMTWQIQEAKNRFCEVVDLALSDGPQTITRHGRATVVIVAAGQYARETRRETLSSILRACPAKGWKVSRDKDVGRTLRFE